MRSPTRWTSLRPESVLRVRQQHGERPGTRFSRVEQRDIDPHFGNMESEEENEQSRMEVGGNVFGLVVPNTSELCSRPGPHRTLLVVPDTLVATGFARIRTPVS